MQSLTRKAFVNTIPDDIPAVLNIPQTWGSLVQTLTGHTDWVSSLAFSPNSQLLVSGSIDHTVRIWETRTGNCRHILHHLEMDAPIDQIIVAFSPDSKLVASGGKRITRIWDAHTGEEVHRLRSSEKTRSVAFSSNSKFLASACYDCTVWVWCVNTGNCFHVFKYGNEGEKDHFLADVAFSPDTRLIASASGLAVKLWSLETGKEVLELLQDNYEYLISVTFSPNSKLLASSHRSSIDGKNTCIHIWCTETGAKLASTRNNMNLYYLKRIAFSSNRELIIPTSRGLHRWEFESSLDPIDTVYNTADTQDFYSVDLSVDAAFFARSTPSSPIIKIWQPSSSQGSSDTQHYHTGALSDYIVRRTNKRNIIILRDLSTVAFSSNTTLSLWRIDTGQCFRTFDDHHCEILVIAFSPDSLTVVSGEECGDVHFWSVKTGQCIYTLQTKNDFSEFSDIADIMAVSANLEIIAVCAAKVLCIYQRRNLQLYSCLVLPNDKWVDELTFTSNNSLLGRLNFLSRGYNLCIDTIGNSAKRRDVSGECQKLSRRDTNFPFIAWPKRNLFGSSDNNGWIKRNEEAWLWVPVEFHLSGDDIQHALGSIVAIYTTSGRLIIVDFSRHPRDLVQDKSLVKHSRIEMGPSDSIHYADGHKRLRLK